MKVIIVAVFCCYLSAVVFSATTVQDALDKEWNKLKNLLPVPIDPLKVNSVNQTWCTCGVFLSGQFKKGSKEAPEGNAALMHEQDSMYPCTSIGAKQCSNKCLETVRVFHFSFNIIIVCRFTFCFFNLLKIFFVFFTNLLSDC